METNARIDGQTDGRTDCFTFQANAVGKNVNKLAILKN